MRSVIFGFTSFRLARWPPEECTQLDRRRWLFSLLVTNASISSHRGFDGTDQSTAFFGNGWAYLWTPFLDLVLLYGSSDEECLALVIFSEDQRSEYSHLMVCRSPSASSQWEFLNLIILWLWFGPKLHSSGSIISHLVLLWKDWDWTNWWYSI